MLTLPSSSFLPPVPPPTDRPTRLTLSMAPVVNESSLVTIHCTVESHPPSTLTLTLTRGQSPESPLEHSFAPSEGNVLTASFTVSVEDAGLYTCQATNSEGWNQTSQELVVNCKWAESCGGLSSFGSSALWPAVHRLVYPSLPFARTRIY